MSFHHLVLESDLLSTSDPFSAGNDNQNTLIDLVSASMKIAGLNVENLNYTLNRSDDSKFYCLLRL